MKSLDPRVKRLPEINVLGKSESAALLSSFEVFVQPREGKPFQHEGSLRACDLELAFVLAKETFTRRFTCISLWVAETNSITVSVTTDSTNNIFDTPSIAQEGAVDTSYEIFAMPKRGKQHIHLGAVDAESPGHALKAAQKFKNTESSACNLWAVPKRAIRYTLPDERDLWATLPEKKFRDAAEYKGGDKLKNFLNPDASQ